MTKRRVVHIKILKRARNKLLDAMMGGVITPNEIIHMNKDNINPLSIAIAGNMDQSNRTPAPHSDLLPTPVTEATNPVPEKRKMNRLTLGQAYALKAYLEQFKLSLIGKTTEQVAVDFNFHVANVHSDFSGGCYVTQNNVYNMLNDLGLSVHRYKIIALTQDVFTSLAPSVAEMMKATHTITDPGHPEAAQLYPPSVERPELPKGLKEVAAFEDEAGNRYDTLAAYYESVQQGELVKVIVEHGYLNSADAYSLARAIADKFYINRK